MTSSQNLKEAKILKEGLSNLSALMMVKKCHNLPSFSLHSPSPVGEVASLKQALKILAQKNKEDKEKKVKH